MLLSAINRRIVSAIRLDRLLRYATLFAAICVSVVMGLINHRLSFPVVNRYWLFLILLHEWYHCSCNKCLSIR